MAEKPPLTSAQRVRLVSIDNEIDRLGREIDRLRKEAAMMMDGRVVGDRKTGIRFRIDRAYTIFGGMGGVWLYFKGPRITARGVTHKSVRHVSRFDDLGEP